jgi:ATP-dependent DNA ligase
VPCLAPVFDSSAQRLVDLHEDERALLGDSKRPQGHEVPVSEFAGDRTADEMKGCVWLKPEVVVRIDFREWTEAHTYATPSS